MIISRLEAADGELSLLQYPSTEQQKKRLRECVSQVRSVRKSVK